jgi:uncharacterized protein YvpB
MGSSFRKTVYFLLTAAVLLSVSSCAKNTSSKDARKVSADSPWFIFKTYDIDVGADPNKGIENFNLHVAGADDKYVYVYDPYDKGKRKMTHTDFLKFFNTCYSMKF